MSNRIKELIKESQEELTLLQEQINGLPKKYLEELSTIKLKLQLELIRLNNLKQQTL